MRTQTVGYCIQIDRRTSETWYQLCRELWDGERRVVQSYRTPGQAASECDRRNNRLRRFAWAV